MSASSAIEWTEVTWNPVTGCTKISQGCKRCYAERLSGRLQGMGVQKYRNGFSVTTHAATLDEPLKWVRPRLVFVNSMSDLFHKSVPAEFIEAVFDVMNRSPRHTFQVLTKRPDRVNQLNDALSWTPNIWLGVSIESARWLSRLEKLKKVDAAVKFLSLEPLLEQLTHLPLTGIDWVILGGESGPGARPMEADWAREVRDNCLQTGTPFFFKQWGGINKKRSGRILDGRTWDEMPQARAA